MDCHSFSLPNLLSISSILCSSSFRSVLIFGTTQMFGREKSPPFSRHSRARGPENLIARNKPKTKIPNKTKTALNHPNCSFLVITITRPHTTNSSHACDILYFVEATRENGVAKVFRFFFATSSPRPWVCIAWGFERDVL